EDCNRNGISDERDLEDVTFPFLEAEPVGDRPADWITVADLDEDGLNDVVSAYHDIVSAHSRIDIVLNRGGGTWAPATHHERADRITSKPNAADMNGDGHLDLVLGVA